MRRRIGFLGAALSFGLGACDDSSSSKEGEEPDAIRYFRAADASDGQVSDATPDVVLWTWDARAPCPENQTRCAATGELETLCEGPVERCVAGLWQRCVSDGLERCDGYDNDCDTYADESELEARDDEPYINAAGFAPLSKDCERPVQWGEKSICSVGKAYCLEGVFETCVDGFGHGGVGARVEACNGLDDNCNGEIDESDAPGDEGTGLPLRVPCYTEMDEEGHIIIFYLRPGASPAELEENEVTEFPEYISDRVGTCRAGLGECIYHVIQGCLGAVARLPYENCSLREDVNCDGLRPERERRHIHFILDISGSMDVYLDGIVEKFSEFTERVNDDNVTYSFGVIGSAYITNGVGFVMIAPSQHGINGEQMRELLRTVRDSGIPEGISELTHDAVYGYVKALRTREEEVPILQYNLNPQNQGSSWEYLVGPHTLDRRVGHSIIVLGDENAQGNIMDFMEASIRGWLDPRDSISIMNRPLWASQYAGLVAPRLPDGRCIMVAPNDLCLGLYSFDTPEDVEENLGDILGRVESCLPPPP